MKDPYKVLHLDNDATKEEIKDAYRVLSKAFHPDISKHPNSKEIIIDINNAYEILSDVQKRYDFDNSELR